MEIKKYKGTKKIDESMIMAHYTLFKESLEMRNSVQLMYDRG